MVAEIVGGVLSNSLAIATDAAHLLTDFASFLISLFSIWLSTRPVSKRMSFGWYRAEVIGALMSVLMIWMVTGLLVYMAIERLSTNKIEIEPSIMLITAGAGLAANIFMALTLHAGGGHHHHHHHHHQHNHNHQQHDHGHQQCGSAHADQGPGEQDHLQQQVPLSRSRSNLLANAESMNQSDPESGGQQLRPNNNSKSHNNGGQANEMLERHRGSGNINVRAALIHVIGDFFQSLGVLIAAAVIYFYPEYAIVDPICTFLFSLIVLVTTLTILRDAINVLMEGTPTGINFHEVMARISPQRGVLKVHNLRIWSLSMDKIALSTHIVIDTAKVKQSQALNSAIEMLKSSYGFIEITIQIEEYDDGMRDCTRCLDEEIMVSLANESRLGSPSPSPLDGQSQSSRNLL